MAILLAAVAYAALAVFYIDVLWRFFIYTRGGPSPASGLSLATVILALMDIFLLRRAHAVNPGLWPGVWAFHVSFILVFIGHLRFFFRSMPAWVTTLGEMLPLTGLVFVVSLVYILVYRLAVERGEYASLYNLMLTAGLFFLGLTGVLMTNLYRIDVTAAKEYMMGIFSFGVVSAPASILFALHFLAAFVILAFLPTHIFTAPFITIEARRRERDIEVLLYD